MYSHSTFVEPEEGGEEEEAEAAEEEAGEEQEEAEEEEQEEEEGRRRTSERSSEPVATPSRARSAARLARAPSCSPSLALVGSEEGCTTKRAEEEEEELELEAEFEESEFEEIEEFNFFSPAILRPPAATAKVAAPLFSLW